MKKIFIAADDIDSSIVEGISNFVKEGKIIAIPTETVYGLLVCAENQEAVDRLYTIKERPKDKPFTYVEDDIDTVINDYFILLSPFGYRLIEKFWPGALTIVYYSKENSDKTIGVRIPSHPVAREIIRVLDKKAVLPSANISGQIELNTPEEIEKVFDDKIDLIVESNSNLISKMPSTVIDLTYKPFKILREGFIQEREIIDVFIKKRILFVCTGNTCRSPMALFLFNKYLLEKKPYYKDRFEVLSCGILQLKGAPISFTAGSVLKEEEGIDTSDFKSTFINRRLLLSSDLIFVMEDSHIEAILKIEPSVEGRLFNLKKFLPHNLEKDIPDPIGKSYEFYKEVYFLIKKAILELVEWL